MEEAGGMAQFLRALAAAPGEAPDMVPSTHKAVYNHL